MSNDPENSKVIESVSLADLVRKRPAPRRTPAFFRALRRCWLSCGFAAFMAFAAATAVMKMRQPGEFFSKALTTAVESGKLNVTSVFLLFAGAVILAALARFVFCLLDEIKKSG
jgi:hypothetical protein